MEEDNQESNQDKRLHSNDNTRPVKKTAIVVLVVVGLSLIVMSVLMNVIVKKIVNVELHANLALNPGKTERYEQWKFPTVPIHIEFYLFNLVNPDEIKSGKTPVVQQIGPYAYREFLEKKNISFDEEEPFVSYNQKKWFVYDADLSCKGCNPFSDKVTTINIPYAIMAEVAKGYPELVRRAIDGLLVYENENLFMTRTVQEIIWGYNDPLFAEFSKLKKKFSLSFLPDLSPVMNLEYNETYDGVVTAYTGNKDLKRTLAWRTWKGKSSVGIWNTTYANMLNGSDGTQFPPGSTRQDKLYFFSPNLCRSMYVTFDSGQQIKGVPVNRFTTPPSFYQNFTDVASNGDFCLGRCYPNGILAGSRNCEPSSVVSPIVISTPHFLLGDPYLRKQVEGLSPNEEQHGLFISIEPMTGIPLQALIRLQINVLIQPVSGITQTVGIKQAFVPVMYFCNNATVDDATAKLMRDDILFPVNVCFYAQIAGFCLGGLLTLVGVMLAAYRINKRRTTQQNSNPAHDPVNECKSPANEDVTPNEENHTQALINEG